MARIGRTLGRVVLYAALIFVIYMAFLGGSALITSSRPGLLWGLGEYAGTALIPIVIGMISGYKIYSRHSGSRWFMGSRLTVLAVCVAALMAVYAASLEILLFGGLYLDLLEYGSRQRDALESSVLIDVVPAIDFDLARYAVCGVSAAFIAAVELRLRQRACVTRKVYSGEGPE